VADERITRGNAHRFDAPMPHSVEPIEAIENRTGLFYPGSFFSKNDACILGFQIDHMISISMVRFIPLMSIEDSTRLFLVTFVDGLRAW
jgi:hypothetical protein